MPARLLAWRDHPRRLSRTAPEYAQQRFVAAKAHFLACGYLAARSDYVLWGYGSTGKALAQALLGLGRRPAAIVDLHPGRLGNRILGAEVLAPTQLERLRGWPLLVSVAGVGPRAEIRAELAARGWREVVDFVCVA